MLCSRLCFWADDRGRGRMSSRLWGASHKVSFLLKGFLWEIDDHLRLKSLATSRKEVWDSFGVFNKLQVKIIKNHQTPQHPITKHKCLELTVNDLEKLWFFFSFSLNPAYISLGIPSEAYWVLKDILEPWSYVFPRGFKLRVDNPEFCKHI